MELLAHMGNSTNIDDGGLPVTGDYLGFREAFWLSISAAALILGVVSLAVGLCTCVYHLIDIAADGHVDEAKQILTCLGSGVMVLITIYGRKGVELLMRRKQHTIAVTSPTVTSSTIIKVEPTNASRIDEKH
jgi:hypothetical protein